MKMRQYLTWTSSSSLESSSGFLRLRSDISATLRNNRFRLRDKDQSLSRIETYLGTHAFAKQEGGRQRSIPAA